MLSELGLDSDEEQKQSELTQKAKALPSEYLNSLLTAKDAVSKCLKQGLQKQAQIAGSAQQEATNLINSLVLKPQALLDLSEQEFNARKKVGDVMLRCISTLELSKAMERLETVLTSIELAERYRIDKAPEALPAEAEWV